MQAAPRRTWLTVAFGAIACAVALVAVVRAPSWTVDDAFIVARYADHAVAHGRLAFNLDGDRVEGFTSVAAMIVAVVARAFGWDPITAVKVVCEASFVATPALVVLLAHELALPPLAGGAVALLESAIAERATHATSGLETELFVFATLLVVVFFARASRGGSVALLAIACAFASFVRPEGILSAIFLAFVVGRTRAYRAALLAFVLPVTALLIVRFAYFGDVVPNTFHAKSGKWNTGFLTSFAEMMRASFVAPLFAAAATWAAARLLGHRAAVAGHPVVALSAAAVALHALGYSRSELVMDYAHRFSYHALAYVTVLVLYAASFAVASARSTPLAVLAALGVFASLAHDVHRASIESARSALYAFDLDTTYAAAGRFIAASTGDAATLAVYPDAGLVPYLAKRRTVDFGGLNDRVLARARNTDDIVRYFFERDPDALVVTFRGPDPWDAGAAAILADGRFDRRYRSGPRFPTGWGPVLVVYLRSP